VSTPTARAVAIAMSRIRWYSRSVKVIAGVTVTESPVCTPIGSMFSIEQTITALSLRSRISSSSNSFQPRIDSSSSTSGVQPRPGDAVQVGGVAGDAGPGSAERERGPDHQRVAEQRRGLLALVERVADAAVRDLGAEAGDDLLEPPPVLARPDRLDDGFLADVCEAVESCLLQQGHVGVKQIRAEWRISYCRILRQEYVS
jgi:hypothetical protein